MKVYTLIAGGERISVSKKVYREYYKHYEHERYIEKVSSKKNLSFNALKEQGYPIENKMLDKQISISEEVITKIMIEKMLKSIGQLNTYEKMIIEELFFNDKSERKLAKELSISQSTLSYRKKKLLEKLKKIIKE